MTYGAAASPNATPAPASGDDPALSALAHAAGIALEWTDNDGVTRRPSPDTLRALLASLDMPCVSAADVREHLNRLQGDRKANLLPRMITAWSGEEIVLPLHTPAHARVHVEYDTSVRQDLILRLREDGRAVIPALTRPGYHRIEWNGQSCTLALAPPRAFSIADVANGARIWGLAAQTYGLSRSAADYACGAGTFGDAAALAQLAGAAGADALMLSPAHALFNADPSHYSPYSPSNRDLCNVLLADASLVFDEEWIQPVYAQCALDGGGSDSATTSLIDWPHVSRRANVFLRALFARFRSLERAEPGHRLVRAFRAFTDERGTSLADHALFETLHAYRFSADTSQWHWRAWPEAFQSPRSRHSQSFARDHADDHAYHSFAQWLVFASGTAAQQRALQAGMRIGLIADLAVGVNASGSQVWSKPEDYLQGVSIGAPPDALGPRGQDWDLTTFSPFAMGRNGFATFLSMLRASFAIAGGVRIDHVMGLQRLWLIPEGGTAAHGAYVSYPFEDLLRLVVLESWRAKKIVIGEDLGIVPFGLRETLDKRGLAGMRVLIFEKDGDVYRPPGHYPRGAVAMTTTHDTATLIGWQRGSDIDLREALDQLPPGVDADRARLDREADREAAERMFAAAGLGPSAQQHMTSIEREEKFSAEAIAFLAQGPSMLALVPLEDISGATEQPNLPGTVDEHPNWRRRYAKPVETILADHPAAGHIDALSCARPRAKAGD